MRIILADWLTDVAEHYRLHDRTLQLAISYLDTYLCQKQHFPKDSLQLLGVACLKLADNFNERSREFYRMISAQEYSQMTAAEFSSEQVV